MKKLLLSALLGGLAAYIWSTISWMALPWHTAQMKGFTDEAAVGAALAANAPATGLYILPMCPPGATTEQQEQHMAKAARGPYFWGIVRTQPVADVGMFPFLLRQYLIQFAGAFLFAALLLTARPLSYWARVWFVVVAALAGGIICYLPEWNWWEVPTTWTLVALADVALGWFLAGLVIARFAPPREQAA